MKLGMIVRMDRTGLGNQTKELAYMLKPDKLLIINSSPFKAGTQQYPEWYKDFPIKAIANGFPSQREKQWFLQGINAFITCEIPYGYDLITEANRRGVRSFIQYNYEFLDYLQTPRLPCPTQLLSPSSWGAETVKEKLNVQPVLLRPPVSLDKFKKAREQNFARTGKKRFLHIEGIKAVHDRNGTESLLRALELTNTEFELVVKTQGLEQLTNDSRVVYDTSNPVNNEDLYYNFDAIIMPRRYGGLCLPMNEGLAAGLPVIMTDINPNNDLLPKDWLIPAEKIGSFMARTEIDIYAANEKKLAKTIDSFAQMSDNSIRKEKELAFTIAQNNFSSEALIDKYTEVLYG